MSDIPSPSPNVTRRALRRLTHAQPYQHTAEANSVPPPMTNNPKFIRHTEIAENALSMTEFFEAHGLKQRVRWGKVLNLHDGRVRIADMVCARMTEVERDAFQAQVCISGLYDGKPVYAIIYSDRNYDNEIIEDISEPIHTTTELYGDRDAVNSLSAEILERFESEHQPMMKWWFQGSQSVNSKHVVLPKVNQDVRAELYPDIGSPDDFIKRYLASDESVLLLAGPPGTGKTTLLRYMITASNLYAHIIYDERLMQSDAIFQSFLFEKESDIMVIEDADTLLMSREQDGNKMMSRFLNVSDGLVKLPNKKLVFTTNITDFNKIDPAILRPGRCFGLVKTRELDLAEAQTAAKAYKLPIPTEKRHYTLAELFNQKQTPRPRSIGFGGA